MIIDKLNLAHELANTYAKAKGKTIIETIFHKEREMCFRLKIWDEKYPSPPLAIDDLLEKLTEYVEKIKKMQ